MKEEDNKSIVKADSTAIKVKVNTPDLNYIKKLVAEVSSGPLVKPFIIKEGEHKGEVDEGAIIANMVLGKEMGYDYMASLALGTKINAKTYMSVVRGRELGIDNTTSMSKIYHIPTSNGDVISLAKDIIFAKILESGTTFKYIRKYKPTPMYRTLANEYLGHKHLLFEEDGTLDDSYFLFINGIHKAEDATKAKNNGKLVIYQSGITFVSTIHIIREAKAIDEIFHYSIQEAIDAKLHRGFHSSMLNEKGKPLYMKGKDNWNNHPATHLNGRTLDLIGRIVVADVLAGNYSHEETIEILDDPNIKTVKDLARKVDSIEPVEIEVEVTNKLDEITKENKD